MNSQHVILMVLLDLGAAFDTVDHNILLERLRKNVSIHRKVLSYWFRSYLSNRSQQVSIDGSLSRQFQLNRGVPQGSFLGPMLVVIYTSSLIKVISSVTPRKFTVSRRHATIPPFQSR